MGAQEKTQPQPRRILEVLFRQWVSATTQFRKRYSKAAGPRTASSVLTRAGRRGGLAPVSARRPQTRFPRRSFRLVSQPRTTRGLPERNSFVRAPLPLPNKLLLSDSLRRGVAGSVLPASDHGQPPGRRVSPGPSPGRASLCGMKLWAGGWWWLILLPRSVQPPAGH